MEWDLIEVGQRLACRAIADDPDNVTPQFARALPIQQVGKTVVVGGGQDGNLGAVVRQCQVVVDQETFGQRLEILLEFGDWNIEPIQIPFEP